LAHADTSERNLAITPRGCGVRVSRRPFKQYAFEELLTCPSYKLDRLELIDFFLAGLSIAEMIFALIPVVIASPFSGMKTQRRLALENVALRHQVVMLKRSVKRARPNMLDRFFWISFARFVSDWRKSVIASHPDTIVRWHRVGFRRY
jgi:hypothetical protein